MVASKLYNDMYVFIFQDAFLHIYLSKISIKFKLKHINQILLAGEYPVRLIQYTVRGQL